MFFLPLSLQLKPGDALQQLADLPWPVLLESARFHPLRGRYSYFSAAPRMTWKLEQPVFGCDPFAEIRQVFRESTPVVSAAGPPFQGGVIGLLSYELGECWERLPSVPRDDFTPPALLAGLYDWCLCWDHLEQKVWLIMPEDPRQASGKLTPRERDLWERLELLIQNSESLSEKATEESPENPAQNSVENCLPETAWEEQFYPASNRTFAEYCADVQRVTDYIAAGDIYQANLSRKIHYPYAGSPLELYRQTCAVNPAPFAAYFQPEQDWALISASPEQFLQVQQRNVITRPIKGTRPRWGAGELDLYQGVELQASEKDRAENTMIVDLLRNDLSRVCEIGSVKVPRWCELESFEKVHHLVSEVTGVLRTECDLWDLLAATFPGGSITGAPKIRAMEIIAELEGVARGAYCGSLFAAGWQGTLQSSILIRTLTWKNGWVQCPVGGGIVADSQPESEYQETVVKSAGLLLPSQRSCPSR